MLYSHSYFFDLSNYAHSMLFDPNQQPWEVLTSLKSYFANLKLGSHEGTISPQAYLIHPELISIGQGSIIEPGAYIQGPCMIGRNCTIRHGAYIRGHVLTGDHCVIGHVTEIKHSILLDHAHAAHFAYVGDSILGNHVNLGAGVKCANFRLDQQTIATVVGEKRYQTGMRKLGAIIGDSTQIGCNSVTNPGTLIGQSVRCYPSMTLGKFIKSHTNIKSH